MDANLVKTEAAKSLRVHPTCVGLSGGADLLDAETLLASCGDDPILLNKMIGLFSAYAPNHLGEIQSAIECADTVELHKAAHRLKGLVSSFSTSAATGVATLERMAEIRNSEELARHYSRVSDMIDAVGAALAVVTIEELKQRVPGRPLEQEAN